MASGFWQRRSLVSLFAVFALVVAGCGQTDDKGAQTKEKGDKSTQVADAKKDDKKGDHGGWWCVEHGIPEKDCSMCLPDKEVKKRFKDKGDWCEKHDRAMSQCFKCEPKLREKFAAQYRAKYGKEPPPIEDDEKKDDKSKKDDKKG